VQHKNWLRMAYRENRVKFAAEVNTQRDQQASIFGEIISTHRGRGQGATHTQKWFLREYNKPDPVRSVRMREIS
jgi:hypothetical protein